MKRIEDKTFSKRKAELNKKARRLSDLHDADVAVVVVSSGGELYEYCSGGTDSMEPMLSRYQNSCLHTEEDQTTKEAASKDTGSTKFRTCKELLQSVKRLDEEPSKFSMSDMAELEVELTAALMHTRSRKTELMLESMSNLHEQEKKLTEENEELKKQVASVKDNHHYKRNPF
ncbi:hypothetical protein L1887_02199 [Cichorium endivia]|nr:hypothetical protein L1887_02199 [Cichorium endivia]